MKHNLDKLIVVAGHAAFRADVLSIPKNPIEDSYWVLQDFQKGEPPYYVEHIRKGLELLQLSKQSLLLFSGGHTRKEAGHWSEAASYRKIAEVNDYWASDPEEVGQRIDVEEYARDSFENLQFSLYRFYQLLGKYPASLTVVGWEFKRERFDVHREALDIPRSKFTYVGCNNPQDLEGAQRGEARTLELFKNDPMGNRSPLIDKKQERDPYGSPIPYGNEPSIRLG